MIVLQLQVATNVQLDVHETRPEEIRSSPERSRFEIQSLALPGAACVVTAILHAASMVAKADE